MRVGLCAAIFMFLKKKHKGFSLPSLTQGIAMIRSRLGYLKKNLNIFGKRKAKQTFAYLPMLGCIYEGLFRLYTSYRAA